MKTTSGRSKLMAWVAVGIRSDCACRERTRLVLYQSSARLSRDRTGDGGEGLALWLLLASAQRQLGFEGSVAELSVRREGLVAVEGLKRQ